MYPTLYNRSIRKQWDKGQLTSLWQRAATVWTVPFARNRLPSRSSSAAHPQTPPSPGTGSSSRRPPPLPSWAPWDHAWRRISQRSCTAGIQAVGAPPRRSSWWWWEWGLRAPLGRGCRHQAYFLVWVPHRWRWSHLGITGPTGVCFPTAPTSSCLLFWLSVSLMSSSSSSSSSLG